jgi:hypothetical protein
LKRCQKNHTRGKKKHEELVEEMSKKSDEGEAEPKASSSW